MDITQEKLQQMLQDDFARPVNGYEGYFVTRIGQILSTKRRSITTLSGRVNKMGYIQQGMINNKGELKYPYVHRLVAIAYLPNGIELNDVNHKNEIKGDNRCENLEWCTRLYNNMYNGRTKRVAEKRGRKIAQIDNAGYIIHIYQSHSEARRNGFTHAGSCARGERKYCKGYKWQYIDTMKKSDYDNSKLLRSV